MAAELGDSQLHEQNNFTYVDYVMCVLVILCVCLPISLCLHVWALAASLDHPAGEARIGE